MLEGVRRKGWDEKGAASKRANAIPANKNRQSTNCMGISEQPSKMHFDSVPSTRRMWSAFSPASSYACPPPPISHHMSAA